MNKTKFILIFFLLLLSFTMLSFSKHNSITFIDEGTEGVLSDEEYDRNVYLALNGDQYAAYNLFEHYLSIHLESKEEFLRNALYWATIAGENDTYGRNMYVLYSFNRTYNFISDARAIFWLQKSAELKYEDALREIERMEIPSPDDCGINKIICGNNVKEYIECAESGDQYASTELVRYYRDLNDDSQAEHWLRIGSQNGNKECMKNYADVLRKSNDSKDKIRATFWENKAEL